MRYTKLLAPTLKETPADAVVVSHRLMLRAGYVRKLAAGIYTYLPLAQRTFTKVANIIRDELNRAGAQELTMPAVQPAELWQESGRWEQYGPELLRFKDRKGSDFVIGPTHEEVITALVRDEVKSYKQLPLNLYQIQTKFRDEVRPRFGIMRGREFVMKDAYSFHVDEADAHKEYDNMFRTYTRIFARCGLRFRAVEADTGSIGGNRSHEFQVLAESGEDAIVFTVDAAGKPSYAANVELAPVAASTHAETPTLPSSVVDTPKKKTIEEVAGFLGVAANRVLKAVLFLVDGAPVMAVCLGDRDINEVKLRKLLGAKELRLLLDDEAKALGLKPGFVGPVGLKEIAPTVKLAVDHGINGLAGLVCGANAWDKHLVQVAWGRELVVADDALADLTTAKAGDRCGKNGDPYQAARGIEVGHVFFLGTKYSTAMKATFQGEDKIERPYVMGCYGIGVTRTAAAAIEQNHDDDGIRWPAPIAPFHVSLIALDVTQETMDLAAKLEGALEGMGIEVLFDDRDERPGVKFKDHDLIGNPVRLAVGGKSLKEGVVEVKLRTETKEQLRKVPVQEAVHVVAALVNGLLADARKAADDANA
ncbi:MAG: proline--tRNA ligase [Deltaproteobacteria bacterium]|nr:proline--tRNA ligase [Deltaproteobacteria bacterium]